MSQKSSIRIIKCSLSDSNPIESYMIAQIDSDKINKKNFGLDKIERLNLKEQQINGESRFHNFYVIEPEQKEVNFCKSRVNVSLIPGNFLNIIVIPDGTEISILDSNEERKMYDLNDLEYCITDGCWQPYGLQYATLINNKNIDPEDLNTLLSLLGSLHNDIKDDPTIDLECVNSLYNFALNCKTYNIMLAYMRTQHDAISNTKKRCGDNFDKDYMSCLTINEDTIIKKNYTEVKQVYCAIQDDKVIGIADISKKEDLEKYFE